MLGWAFNLKLSNSDRVNFVIFFIENLKKLDEICETHSSPARLWIGPRLALVVHDVEDVETILKSPHCLNRMSNYVYLREGIFGDVDGLFTSGG